MQAYIDLDTVWHATDSEERGPHPDILAAQAAATAIAGLDGAHEKSMQAAEFLIEHTSGFPGRDPITQARPGQHVAAAPGVFELAEAAVRGGFLARKLGEHPEIDAFFEDFDLFIRDDPVASATARYYAAERQMRLANAVDTPPAERPRYRARGINLATGLECRCRRSEELVKRRRFRDDGTPVPFPTLAESEEDLLYNLNFLTVGNRIPDVSASRLDGVEESVSTYQGQAVLLDFWATWCAPCVESIPKMVELDESIPDDEFEILSISVDEQVSTVAEFQDKKPDAVGQLACRTDGGHIANLAGARLSDLYPGRPRRHHRGTTTRSEHRFHGADRRHRLRPDRRADLLIDCTVCCKAHRLLWVF